MRRRRRRGGDEIYDSPSPAWICKYYSQGSPDQPGLPGEKQPTVSVTTDSGEPMQWTGDAEETDFN